MKPIQSVLLVFFCFFADNFHGGLQRQRILWHDAPFSPEHLEGGQKNFENGDITCCEAHHNMAIFYAQTDNQNLSVDVIPIGKVTSDPSVFGNPDSQEEVAFPLAE